MSLGYKLFKLRVLGNDFCQVLKSKYIVYFCHYLQTRYIKKKTLDVVATDITKALNYRIHDLQQKI